MSEPTQTNRKKSRRRNGDGNTYRHKNGWRTVISHKGHTVTAMGRSEQESRRLAKEKIKALPIYDGSLVPAAAKLTTGEYLTNWITKKHKTSIAATTYRRYASLINIHIIPALGSIKLQAITKNHINALMLQMREKGQSARSQQQARAVLSAAFESALEDDLVTSNPVIKSRTITLDSAQIHPLSLAEVHALLAKTKGVQMQARVRMAVLYAMRQGEALGLRWQDIDFGSGILEIRNQIQMIEGKFQLTGLKTDRSRRSVALTSASLLALEKHQVIVQKMRDASGSSWTENDFVFPYFDGSAHPSTPDYNNWKRCLRLCGIKTRRLHDARHTAATLMYAQGVGIEVISRALGHSSSAITSKLYVHSAIEPQIEAANMINAALFSN